MSERDLTQGDWLDSLRWSAVASDSWADLLVPMDQSQMALPPEIELGRCLAPLTLRTPVHSIACM